jgi:integrase
VINSNGPPILDRVRKKIRASIGSRRIDRYNDDLGMRVLRAIWRTGDSSPETSGTVYHERRLLSGVGLTAVIANRVAWWKGVSRSRAPVRRDFYIWLAFSGCRAGETTSMVVKNVDLNSAW